MSERIDETLRKIAANTSKASTPISSNTDAAPSDLPGDPDCPVCGGVGYLRLDLPLGHPDFGKVQPCTCRQARLSHQVHNRLYAMSNLEKLHHLTFENFQPRGRIGLGPLQANTLERAYNQASQFAGHLDGWLFIHGPYGCGKTHLAAAIANFAVSLGVPTLFLTVPDLLDALRFAYQDPEETFEQRFEEIRRSQLLVMDDFGTQNATPWAQEKLFQILNYRYINRLPTVITSNLELEEIEERIRSRLGDPELVTRLDIDATDYRNPFDEYGHSSLSSLDLLHDRTFGNWRDRRNEGLLQKDIQSLEKAFRAANNFAEEPTGWLLITGLSGTGKTHLAAAIGNYRLKMGERPIFVSALDLLDHLRATFNPDSKVRFDQRFQEVLTTPLLILDDLGTQSITPWVHGKLVQLFDYRYNAKLPTVITSVEPLDEIDSRLRSRLVDTRLCKVFAIDAPAYRGFSARPRKPAANPR
jgi:DNA replication protein DnaC